MHGVFCVLFLELLLTSPLLFGSCLLSLVLQLTGLIKPVLLWLFVIVTKAVDVSSGISICATLQ